MQKENLLQYLQKTESIFKLVLIFFSTSFLPFILISVILETKDRYGDLNPAIPYYLSGVLFVLFFYSMAMIFAESDKELLESYKARFKNIQTANKSRKQKVRFIANSKMFWLESGILVSLCFLLTPGWVLDFNTQVFTDTLFTSHIVIKILLSLFVVSILFVSKLSVLSGFDISFYNKARQSDLSRRIREWNFYIKWGINFLLFSLIFYLTGLALPGLKVVVDIFTVIPVYRILIYIVLLLILKKILSITIFLHKRRRFLKNLRQLCEREGYEIKDNHITYSYRSIAKPFKGESFLVTAHGESYSCKILGFTIGKEPLFFHEEKTEEKIRFFRIFKKELFKNSKLIDFDYESSNIKVLILNPTPKSVFLHYMGKNTEIENGDRIGEYIIFNGTGFLNALGRNTITFIPKDYIKY